MFDGLSTEVTLLNQFKDADSTGVGTVSYTHLTLPTMIGV